METKSVVMIIAIRTKQKVTQYTLGVVLGGLPLAGIFINVAAPIRFSLYQEKRSTGSFPRPSLKVPFS